MKQNDAAGPARWWILSQFRERCLRWWGRPRSYQVSPNNQSPAQMPTQKIALSLSHYPSLSFHWPFLWEAWDQMITIQWQRESIFLRHSFFSEYSPGSSFLIPPCPPTIAKSVFTQVSFTLPSLPWWMAALLQMMMNITNRAFQRTEPNQSLRENQTKLMCFFFF